MEAGLEQRPLRHAASPGSGSLHRHFPAPHRQNTCYRVYWPPVGQHVPGPDGSEENMASFNDLGLREPLVMALEEEGIEHPTALQQAAIPVLRREGNLVARASSGSGKTLAYALGVLDRIEPRAATGDATEGDDEAAGGEAQGTRV